jgi:uncharacterized protein (TIGR02391 family)
MLTGDAKLYFDTFVRKRRDELLNQRKTDRETVGGGLVNFEDAAKRAGYTGMFQPDRDFMAGQAHAHAEGVQKAYENIGQPLTQQIIDTEIMPQVERILVESSAGIISREQGRVELLSTRTRKMDAGASAKLRSLKRHLEKHVHETREAIRNEATLKMLDAKKTNITGRKRGAVLPTGEYAYHPEIQKVSQQAFLEGNFRGAVLDAFIHLIDAVKNKTGLPHEGDDLMNKAFSSKDGHPVVRFNELRSDAEKNEQNGIWWLFRGVVGMRNYKAHKVTPFDDPHRAHEYLALASLLMRLLDNATIQKPEQGTA